MAIVVNKPLPEFEANATGGLKVSNTSHNGKIMILYFYPKDNTPGCTTEAMQFRDKYKDFAKAGATVFGVSRDNMKSHDDFKAKLELPFELIVRFHVVAGNAQNGSPSFGKIFEFVAKLHGFRGATRRVVLRIEVQNHDFAIV